MFLFLFLSGNLFLLLVVVEMVVTEETAADSALVVTMQAVTVGAKVRISGRYQQW